MKKILIMGCGYIGLPTAVTFALAGYEVCGFDVNEQLVQGLNQGKVHIAEPGLQEAFDEASKTGRLSFAAIPQSADVYIIAVQTPYVDFGGKRASDLRYVESAAGMIGNVIRPGDLVVLESTSPPKTTRRVEEIVERVGGISRDDFMTAHCPERIIPGRMLQELRENDRIIGARTERAAAYSKEVYAPVVTKGRIRLTDDLTAEMCKLTENTYRDVNIAFANELSKVCGILGIDVFNLIELANCHPRVNVHQPGVGVGGHCIAVDPWFIHEQFQDDTPLIHNARLVNDGKPRWVAVQVQKSVGPGQCVAVLGLSYKDDVDDFRESPSIELCGILKDMGYRVIGCEPNIGGPVEGYENFDLKTALDLCDYVVIARKHREFIEGRGLIKTKPYYDCVGLMR